MVREKKVIYLLLFFLCIRLIALMVLPAAHTPPIGDAIIYNNYASTILENFNWLHSAKFGHAERPPGYPIFLALIYILFGAKNILAVQIIQAIINIITVYLIYRLALKMFGKAAARAALLWSGFYVFYIWFALFALRETLLCFLFIATFYFLYSCLKNTKTEKNKFYIFLFSLCYFCLIYTDCRYLHLILPMLIIIIIYKGLWKGIKAFSLFILIVLLLSTPWAIRNYMVYGGFVTISNRFFRPGINIMANFRYRMTALNTRTYTVSRNENYPSKDEIALIQKGLNPKARSQQEITAIRRGAKPASTYLGRIGFRARELWRPFMLHGIYTPFPGNKFLYWSMRHNLVSIISYGALLPFVFIAVIILVIKKKKEAYFFILPILTHTIIHAFIWGEYRYRIPIDSFLIILGANGIVFVYANLHKAGNKRINI